MWIRPLQRSRCTKGLAGLKARGYAKAIFRLT